MRVIPNALIVLFGYIARCCTPVLSLFEVDSTLDLIQYQIILVERVVELILHVL